MLLDGLVRDLATDSVPDRGHQDLGRGQEWQVAVEFTLHDGRIRAELVENRKESLEDSVCCEESAG